MKLGSGKHYVLVIRSGNGDKGAMQWLCEAMKMGELGRRTGVNRETIRVLLRKGLVPQPERPKPTIAKFSE